MHPPAQLAWGMWALGASLYLVGFFQRVAPAVMTQELMAEFSLAAAGLGNLSAFYLYGYVVMQIPTGLMVDRYGARRVLATGAAVAAAGSFLFALVSPSPSVLLAVLVIAGFASGCMVTGFAYAKESVPARLAGTATGVANMGSMTGPMLLQPLIGVILDHGWLGELTYAGARAYGAQAYRDAFMLLLGWLAVSFACALATRETHAQQMR